MRLGIFDSGFGGLTVYRSVQARLPQYDYLYLGDNARTPYGNRSFEAILQFTKEGVEYLFQQGCILVVIACNTASAKALRTLQEQLLPHRYPDRKLLGIIRPSAEALAQKPKGSHVALWATEGTVRSQSYALEMDKLSPSLFLSQLACPLLVSMVEAGELSGFGVEFFLKQYWQQTLDLDPEVQSLLLACTHYPLLYPTLRKLVPAQTEILIQGDIVAPSLESYLFRHPEIQKLLTQNGTEEFRTTDQPEGFERLGSLFLGKKVIADRVSLMKKRQI